MLCFSGPQSSRSVVSEVGLTAGHLAPPRALNPCRGPRPEHATVLQLTDSSGDPSTRRLATSIMNPAGRTPTARTDRRQRLRGPVNITFSDGSTGVASFNRSGRRLRSAHFLDSTDNQSGNFTDSSRRAWTFPAGNRLSRGYGNFVISHRPCGGPPRRRHLRTSTDVPDDHHHDDSGYADVRRTTTTTILGPQRSSTSTTSTTTDHDDSGHGLVASSSTTTHLDRPQAAEPRPLPRRQLTNRDGRASVLCWSNPHGANCRPTTVTLVASEAPTTTHRRDNTVRNCHDPEAIRCRLAIPRRDPARHRPDPVGTGSASPSCQQLKRPPGPNRSP
jgi:hypothetical protein